MQVEFTPFEKLLQSHPKVRNPPFESSNILHKQCVAPDSFSVHEVAV